VRPTQHPIQWAPRFFTGVKRPGREVKHSSPSVADVKNEWSYTPAPPTWLDGVHRENFIHFETMLWDILHKFTERMQNGEYLFHYLLIKRLLIYNIIHSVHYL
jgi:hypothetical protein